MGSAYLFKYTHLFSLLVGAVGIVTTIVYVCNGKNKGDWSNEGTRSTKRNCVRFFLVEALIIGILGASIGLVLGIIRKLSANKIIFNKRRRDIIDYNTTFLPTDLPTCGLSQ